MAGDGPAQRPVDSDLRPTPGAHCAPQATDESEDPYDTRSFVAGVRELGATPHVARKRRCSAIDGRTTRHQSYAVSQRRCKFVEEGFGWMKTVGGLRKLRHRGRAKVAAMFTFSCAAYILVRLRSLLAEPSPA